MPDTADKCRILPTNAGYFRQMPDTAAKCRQIGLRINDCLKRLFDVHPKCWTKNLAFGGALHVTKSDEAVFFRGRKTDEFEEKREGAQNTAEFSGGSEKGAETLLPGTFSCLPLGLGTEYSLKRMLGDFRR